MAAPEKVDWDTCEEDDCIGVRLPSGGKCWAHPEDQDFDAALKRLGEDGDLDARGVQLTRELLGRLLQAAPKDEHHHPVLTSSRFEWATFYDAWFFQTVFQGWAEFNDTTFHGVTSFYGATFHDLGMFARARFKDHAEFHSATFHGGASFYQVTFHRSASFVVATFHRDTWFNEATLLRDSSFQAATFHEDAGFDKTTFHGHVGFDRTIFHRARQVGPMLVRGSLNLDHAVFHQRARIEVSANAICASNARFPAGVHLRARWAQIVLDDADFPAPSLFEATEPFASLDEAAFARVWVWFRRRTPIHIRQRPRLLSVRRADVGGLTVSGIDLTACRFHGAHNLDKVRLEGHLIGRPPKGRWRTQRCTLAEEHHWRHDAGKRGDWYPQPCGFPAWMDLEEPASPPAGQIANLYRALRKAREDAKDEPGAADFYYGEMEMRRHAARHFSPEWWLLTLYWLVSGYALRAWRALVALAVALVLFAALCSYGGGFAPTAAPTTTARNTTSANPAVTTGTTAPRGPTTTTRSTPTTTSAPTTTASVPSTTATSSLPTTTTADTSFGGAVVYGSRTIIGLARDPQPRLTRWGDILQILLRVLGPVLLGLAILSIRGRVKR